VQLCTSLGIVAESTEGRDARYPGPVRHHDRLRPNEKSPIMIFGSSRQIVADLNVSAGAPAVLLRNLLRPSKDVEEPRQTHTRHRDLGGSGIEPEAHGLARVCRVVGKLMSPLATLAQIAMSGPPAYAADPVELAAFVALARPAPTVVLQYGAATSQGVDLFIPGGSGPHPVAILIHGGCWSGTTAGREQLRHIGAELASLGIAVWSIGYRRTNEDGGGYPGTFQDVGLAIDRLRSDAARYHLDLSRTVLVGHSAGGHLALWAAARDSLPAASPLYDAKPFMPRSIISLAGIGDLAAFARFVPVHCGPGVLEKLIPATTSSDPYAEISPAALPAPKGPVVMISGILDRLVPPYAAHDYARAMRQKQATSPELVDIPGAGHFDLVTPGTRAWTEITRRIDAALSAAP
jgi:acetyl esterase/lipase